MKRNRNLILAGMLLASAAAPAQEITNPAAPGTGVVLPEEGFPGAPPLPPDMPPERVPSDIPVETALPADVPPPVPSAAQADADAEYLRQFSLTNAQTRTGFHAALSNGDRFFQGFAGVPHPGFTDLLPLGRPSVFEFHFGPLKVQPQLATGVVVSKISGKDGRTEVEANVTAAFQAELGDPLTGRFVSASYGLAYLFGENRRRSSEVDQQLSILGQYDFDKLRLGAGIQFASLNGDDREFTNGTQRQVLTVSLTSSYQYTERSSFDLDITTPITEFSDGLGSGGVTATVFGNYAFTPKTLFGVGFAAGYLDVQDSESQVFEQVLLRVLSTVNPYFVYFATVGVDFRDFGSKTTVHPLFNIGATWTPRLGTSLTLSAEQRVQNSSSIVNADFLSSSVTLTLSQRLGHDASASLVFGYEHADYESTRTSDNVDRTDDTLFGQLSVSTALSRHCTLQGSLTYRNTNSDQDSQSVKQAGLQVIYNF